MIPLGKPEISKEDIRAVIEVLESGNLATGETVVKFEREFSQFIGRKYAIAVNSGTVALFLAIKTLNLNNVIIPAITCPDVVNAAVYGGANPLIVDVEEDTHNIDPDLIPEHLLKKADSLIITNTYGHPARIDEIREICNEHDLVLIEDFAQSNGAWYKGHRCGSFGDIAVVSFYGPKAMTTGHGGMILTDSDDIFSKVKLARGDEKYLCNSSIIPLNFRITDIQAALGISQLGRLDYFTGKRRAIAKLYDEDLRDCTMLGLLTPHKDIIHSYYKYVLILKGIPKKRFITQMKKEGVQVGTLYDPPLHQMKIVQNIVKDAISLPVAERCAAGSVSLPMYPSMAEQDTLAVIQCVKEVTDS